jgi:hypothetical protein
LVVCEAKMAGEFCTKKKVTRACEDAEDKAFYCRILTSTRRLGTFRRRGDE